MSKTPKFDEKLDAVLVATQPGERLDPLTGERWTLTLEEIERSKRWRVPVSKYAPMTRMKQIFGLNIGIEIWWNKHAETGAPILSYAHPDTITKPIPDTEWQTKDYSSTFHEANVAEAVMPRLVDLISRIPIPALRQYIPPVNSVGVVTLGVEDSFMVFAFKGRRTNYAYLSQDVEDSVDIVFSRQISQCDHLVRSVRMHGVSHGYECIDCLNSAFLFDCRNCEYCFGATNKRNKKYVWFNEHLAKEEWEKRRAEVDLGKWSTHTEFLKRFHDLIREKAVWPENFNIGCTDSTGEYLQNCTRVTDCYWLASATDCRNTWYNFGSLNNLCFVAGTTDTADGYFSHGILKTQNFRFCGIAKACVNIEYCYNCTNCEDCFGCVGLQNKKFRIFNKQYEPEEYWKVLDEIKSAMLERGEYGEFFPLSVSPSGAVFSPVKFLLGASDDELRKLGAPMLDPKRGNVVTAEREADLKPAEVSTIPDSIDDIDPAMFVKKPILDAELGRNYSVLPQEFEMYKTRRLPFPRQHFTSRLKELVNMVNKPVYRDETCDACKKSLRVATNTAFPTRNILCQTCYGQFLEQHG